MISPFVEKPQLWWLSYHRWRWPLEAWSFRNIPVGTHPGAFGVGRTHDFHTGVDLYCSPDTEVFAVETGVVVGKERFTGQQAGSPWWDDTEAILVEGPSGVVLYGEICGHVILGQEVRPGSRIGFTRTVLKKDKGRPMCMLHIELYEHGTTESVWWKRDQNKPANLLDPTEKLLYAFAQVE
jgi:hypothetical protein